MIELDRTLAPLCKVINKCYRALFPELPQFPQFSFTRAMITLWKTKVYPKLSKFLNARFEEMLNQFREAKLSSLLAQGEKGHDADLSLDQLLEEMVEPSGDSASGKEQMLSRLALAIADLSINDLSIHFLGSTKMVPDAPYMSLDELVQKSTKYLLYMSKVLLDRIINIRRRQNYQ